jgi:hypothetical protein
MVGLSYLTTEVCSARLMAAAYALIIIHPALNTVLVAFTNCGDGSRALDKVIERLTGFKGSS